MSIKAALYTSQSEALAPKLGGPMGCYEREVESSDV